MSLEELLRAKKESDRKNYSAKHDIMRKLMLAHPEDYVIDSEVGDIYGITHIPSGFKIHVPRAVVPPAALAGSINPQQRVRIALPYAGGYLMERLSNPKYPENIGKTRFPGGGIEKGETPQQAAVRELQEELGITVSADQFEELGINPHGPHGEEVYLQLKNHGLAPGNYTATVGGDKNIELLLGSTTDKTYWGADLRALEQSQPPQAEEEKRRFYHGSPTPNLVELKPHKDPRTGRTALFVDTMEHAPEIFSLMPARHAFSKDETTRGGKFIKGEIVGKLPLNDVGYVYTVEADPESVVEREPGRFHLTAPAKVVDVRKVTKEEVLAKGWRVKGLEQEDDVYVQSAVPSSVLDMVRKHGLLSSQALMNNPESLKAFLANREGTEWYEDEKTFKKRVEEKLKDSFWSDAVRGPSVLFGEPDPEKITDVHPSRKLKTETLRINLSKLLRDHPKTRIAGSELQPYDPEGPKHQGDLRHYDIDLDKVREYAATDPKELWKHYDSPEGTRYASNVPHAQIITPSGSIAPEYLDFNEKQALDRDILLDLPGLLKQAALKPDVVLQPHQERILEEAGLDTRKLLYHTLGSGKTLSAIAAAEAMEAPYGAVVPAALRANFEKELEKFTDEKRKSDIQSYTMLSKGVEPVHNKTVIFDEAHRLRNPKSKQTIAAKELASKAQQLYLLSGSPIVNAPGDLAPLVEMLTQQPMSTEKFNDEFLGSERIDPSWWQRFRGMKPGVRQYLKQPRKFNKLLEGKVDYHQPATPSVKRIDEDIFVDMGPEQQLLHKAFYNEIPRSLQRKLEKNFPLSKSEAKNLLAFLSGPRQAALSTHPWLSEKQRVAAGISQAPKLQRAMLELEKQIEADPKSRTVVFSNFIEAGLKPYAAALEAKKIPYGIFHGGLTDKQRADVVNKYNSGELRALLLGPAASEGISLSGTNLMQLLDPHWNESRLEQAVGRGIRFDSHGHLPEEEQKVRVQRYISQLPQGRRSVLSGFKRPTRDTADTFLQNYAHEKQRVNDLFLKKLRQIGTPKQALARDIILDLPGLLEKASYLQGGVFAPRGNPTMRSFTANTPAEGFFGEYESVGEWANELPNTVLTRPSEGSFWKGDILETAKSWAGRGMKRRVQERDHARQFRNIQAAIAHREGIDSRNRAWSNFVQSQPTTSVDSPWGKQQTGPLPPANFNTAYNPQGGPGASWDQGMGGVFHDVMRRNPREFELYSSTGNESTWLHKPTGMRYAVPDAPSSSNRFAVHAEQPSFDEWANAFRWRQGQPARNT